MKHQPEAFDVRLMRVPRERFVKKTKAYIFGLFPETRWEREVFIEHEAWIALKISLTDRDTPTLYWAGMTDKGFAIMLDGPQLAGEITSKGWDVLDTFRIDGFASLDKIKRVIGRTRLEGVNLTDARAIAYIFSLRNWEEATIETLKACKKK
jgi:hypothetical protein